MAHRVLSGALPGSAEWQDSATRANAAQADVGCCDVTSWRAGGLEEDQGMALEPSGTREQSFSEQHPQGDLPGGRRV